MDIKTNCYAAVDIGASSGRVVIGEVTPEGTIELTEIHRFDNIQKRSGGHDCWDVDMLFRETLAGLAKCKDAGYAPKTVGIDTWAVDFVLLDEHDNVLGDAVAYRDERTNGMYAVADAIMAPGGIPPHGYPAPAVQHHLPAAGPAARAPRANRSGRNVPDDP